MNFRRIQDLVAQYEKNFSYATNNTFAIGRRPKILMSMINLARAVMETHPGSRVTENEG